MTGIKIVLKWPGKFLLCPKWGRWGIFEPKIIILELSVKSMDFSEIKHDKRLKGKFYSTQNGGNRSFLGSKSTFLKLYLSTGVKKWANATLGFWRKINIILKWIRRSSFRTWGCSCFRLFLFPFLWIGAIFPIFHSPGNCTSHSEASKISFRGFAMEFSTKLRNFYWHVGPTMCLIGSLLTSFSVVL